MNSALLLAAILFAQEGPAKAPQVDEKKVSNAIKYGASWLESNSAVPTYNGYEILVLWTLIHTEDFGKSAYFKSLFKEMLGKPTANFYTTYQVSLEAMILEKLDRVKYRDRIAWCAQFLVDTQLADGSWSYNGRIRGTPVKSKETPTGVDGKTGTPPTIEIKKRGTLAATFGDGSNTQYAALGLRACHDAGILLPDETIRLAMKRWRNAQEGKKGKRSPYGEPRGFGYEGSKSTFSYGSMTAGGVGALCILDHLSGQDPTKDDDVRDGLAWLTTHFSVKANPGSAGSWHFYYLYGLERAGILASVEKLGNHWWYAEGAKYLLENQKDDGSWNGDRADTCFAILFLKRATKTLDVETPSKPSPPKPKDVETGSSGGKPAPPPPVEKKPEEPEAPPPTPGRPREQD